MPLAAAALRLGGMNLYNNPHERPIQVLDTLQETGAQAVEEG
jgi:hypothetical protein